MASASIDFDSPTTPRHPDVFWLARAVGYAALVALGMGLWGTVASEAWRADEAVENDGDFGPGAVVANDVNDKRQAMSTLTRAHADSSP
jgi:hypothetical protein